MNLNVNTFTAEDTDQSCSASYFSSIAHFFTVTGNGLVFLILI